LLAGRRILVGVCGGIAAYKSCEFVRMLQREGAEVRVVLTPAAARFVTPLTFSALSGAPAPVEEFPEAGSTPQGDVYAHLNLTREIDCYVIAPATANTLARLATGQADHLVAACYLSCEAPVVVAPAMNYRMWQHPAVQENVEALRRRGCTIVEPDTGELACGDEGPGRLADLREVFAAVLEAVQTSAADGAGASPASVAEPLLPAGDLSGRRIVVTAGGTREYLDPVRFLTNASSGRLGLGMVAELARRGASVELIDTGIDVDVAIESQLAARDVARTAFDMMSALSRRMETADGLIMLAAVADYGPANYISSKRKKDGSAWMVELTETPDILAGIAAQRRPGQALIGVSLEDTDWINRAMKKTQSKGVDLCIAVELGADLPFGDRRMRCALVDAEQVVQQEELRDKAQIARLTADWLAVRLAADSGAAAESRSKA
jgi:phosphopantothenoylcysteine decarboxylase/phosphopantothenate--cysteine ligase